MKKLRKKSNRPTARYEGIARRQGHKWIIGCDEAGVGALAGPLVAAGVILDPKKPIRGLNDSKKLSPKQRDRLEREIMAKAKDYTVAFYPCVAVDIFNPHKTSRMAMEECVRTLLHRSIALRTAKPSIVLTDAMVLKKCDLPHRAIIHGDAKSISIAAASILAKVARDAYMKSADAASPGWNFSQNKGYGTKDHLEALEQNGVSCEHRKTYEPVKKAIERRHTLGVGHDDSLFVETWGE